VALKLVPNNNTFINVLAAKDETHQMVQDDITSLISLLIPLLSQLHSILVGNFFFFCQQRKKFCRFVYLFIISIIVIVFNLGRNYTK